MKTTYSNRSLGQINRTRRYNIGVSESVVAYMVKIDWTSAPVVKARMNKEFKLRVYRVAVLRGEYEVLSSTQITVKPGQTFYFVQSAGLAGYYYLVQWSMTHFACTCPAGRCNKKCGHQEKAKVFVFRREHPEPVAA